MRFLDWIIEELEGIADWFHEAYHIVDDWVWPFYFLAEPLYAVYGRFRWLAEWFGDFNEWVEDTVDRLRDILDFGDIWGLFRTWFEWAEDAYYWVRYAWDNVFDIVTDWWSTILPYVISYVDTAVQGLSALIEAWDYFWHVLWPDIAAAVGTLQASWHDFWTNIFPTLVSFDWLTTWWNDRVTEVQSLIDSAFTLRDSLWAGWQEIRDTVLEFFADPWAWLYDRFDDFIERFW